MLTEPGLAERCQRAGYSLVAEGYTWDLVAAATLKTYERVLTADA
jgi:glycosyltransferase involved in cell wall biosynthesis